MGLEERPSPTHVIGQERNPIPAEPLIPSGVELLLAPVFSVQFDLQNAAVETRVSFENYWAYILNLTGGNPALASVGTNVTQRPMTGKPLFGDRIATKTGPRQPANLPVKLSI